jgi:hypothetical protein
MTDQDTAELVRRAAAGDELAWRQLIDGLGPLLRQVSSAYRRAAIREKLSGDSRRDDLRIRRGVGGPRR